MTATAHAPAAQAPAPAPAQAPELQRVARTEGLLPALRLLLEAHGGTPPFGPTGHTLLPEPDTGPDAGPDTGPDTRPDPVRRYPLPGGAVVLVHDPRAARAGAAAVDRTALLRLRLGLVQGLRDACLAHLAGRASGGSTVLMQQLVKGQLAEALGHQLELAALLDATAPPDLTGPALRDLHRQLTDTGRALLRLLGAHGYLADGPGATAHVSELLADVHLPAEEDR
ncbi:hypothetical protein K353_02059 [Kitasatospora sp. SolWspMP-SS2h]|uniref:hypothetical protein n=1 Tax=Kitasatospora sp. SolWspMP-SS2h TaxID=1305729 RepID=UPI000DBFAB8F|nr:hypothetical protein [Kitasatospora sp. SolWspMP-SS2h]RAJ43044.1 hypothetical protein K353_02059 [Kitasatospora sp. SolWspMP-SS2h]